MALSQQATAKIGKFTMKLPRFEKDVCDGSTENKMCAKAGNSMSHKAMMNIPDLVLFPVSSIINLTENSKLITLLPLQINGNLAKYELQDENGQTIVCFGMPVFIPQGAKKRV
jgi:hypothetical protein